MLYNIYSAPNEKTSPIFAAAFQKGYGGIITSDYIEGPWAGFGSPQNWGWLQISAKLGYDFIYADHGYFGRLRYFKVTKNDFQHSGIGESDGKRFNRFNIPIRPWRQGKQILICPQSKGHFIMRETTYDKWLYDVIAEVKKHTNKPIKIRHKRDRTPFKHDLKNAYCVITHSSNAAVEAILDGVPAICTDKCAASIMSKSSIADINDLYYPDNRYEWASVLADNQFTLEEIERGQFPI